MSIPEAHELGSVKRAVESIGKGRVALPKGKDVGYERRFFSQDPTEEISVIKQDLAKGVAAKLSTTPDPAYLMPAISDEDVAAVMRKREELDLYNFERYLTELYDPRDPNLSRLLGSMYPEYFERRMAEIDEKLELQKKLEN